MMRFIFIIFKAKRCTCHQEGPISGGWLRHGPVSACEQVPGAPEGPACPALVPLPPPSAGMGSS